MSALGDLQGRRSKKPARKCKGCGCDLVGQGQRCGPCQADRIDELRLARSRNGEWEKRKASKARKIALEAQAKP